MATDAATSSPLRTFAEDYGLLVVAALFAVLGVAGPALFVFGYEPYARTLL
jgi:hypothetical protein